VPKKPIFSAFAVDSHYIAGKARPIYLINNTSGRYHTRTSPVVSKIKQTAYLLKKNMGQNRLSRWEKSLDYVLCSGCF